MKLLCPPQPNEKKKSTLTEELDSKNAENIDKTTQKSENNDNNVDSKSAAGDAELNVDDNNVDNTVDLSQLGRMSNPYVAVLAQEQYDKDKDLPEIEKDLKYLKRAFKWALGYKLYAGEFKNPDPDAKQKRLRKKGYNGDDLSNFLKYIKQSFQVVNQPKKKDPKTNPKKDPTKDSKKKEDPYDGLIFIWLGHGHSQDNQDYVTLKDNQIISTAAIARYFLVDRFPWLKNCPRIFLWDVCRGQSADAKWDPKQFDVGKGRIAYNRKRDPLEAQKDAEEAQSKHQENFEKASAHIEQTTENLKKQPSIVSAAWERGFSGASSGQKNPFDNNMFFLEYFTAAPDKNALAVWNKEDPKQQIGGLLASSANNAMLSHFSGNKGNKDISWDDFCSVIAKRQNKLSPFLRQHGRSTRMPNLNFMLVQKDDAGIITSKKELPIFRPDGSKSKIANVGKFATSYAPYIQCFISCFFV